MSPKSPTGNLVLADVAFQIFRSSCEKCVNIIEYTCRYLEDLERRLGAEIDLDTLMKEKRETGSNAITPPQPDPADAPSDPNLPKRQPKGPLAKGGYG